jgi:hypothetical protein
MTISRSKETLPLMVHFVWKEGQIHWRGSWSRGRGRPGSSSRYRGVRGSGKGQRTHVGRGASPRGCNGEVVPARKIARTSGALPGAGRRPPAGSQRRAPTYVCSIRRSFSCFFLHHRIANLPLETRVKRILLTGPRDSWARGAFTSFQKLWYINHARIYSIFMEYYTYSCIF